MRTIETYTPSAQYVGGSIDKVTEVYDIDDTTIELIKYSLSEIDAMTEEECCLVHNVNCKDDMRVAIIEDYHESRFGTYEEYLEELSERDIIKEAPRQILKRGLAIYSKAS